MQNTVLFSQEMQIKNYLLCRGCEVIILLNALTLERMSIVISFMVVHLIVSEELKHTNGQTELNFMLSNSRLYWPHPQRSSLVKPRLRISV